MNIKDFLKKCDAEIPDTQYERVNDNVRKILDADQNTIIDTHCHIFDKYCVPLPYTKLRLDQLLKRFNIEDSIENIIHSLSQKSDKRKDFENIYNILQAGSMRQVLDLYINKYAISRNTILAVLMMDLEKAWQTKVSKTVSQQIDELKKLSEDYPIMPFFAVDPRKAEDKSDNLYENFLKAFSYPNSFSGVKIYPSLGYLPSDKKLIPIYEVCQKKGIPITSHCGGNMISAITSLTKRCIEFDAYRISKFGLETWTDKICGGYEERGNFFNDPAHWEPVLEMFPDLKLNIAHFGGQKEWINFAQDKQIYRINVIFNLIHRINSVTKDFKYKNLYTDFAFNFHSSIMSETLKKVLDNNLLLRERVLFGTDYWVVLPYADNFKQDLLEFKSIMGEYWKAISFYNPKRFLFG